jgi:hypothetical protein
MQVEADCAYCILESIEWVCGKGCVTEKLHISTDYAVMPRPCIPELVEVLAASNAEHASAALGSGKPFGLTLPDETNATDIFVPAGEDAHGAPAYNAGITCSDASPKDRRRGRSQAPATGRLGINAAAGSR